MKTVIEMEQEIVEALVDQALANDLQLRVGDGPELLTDKDDILDVMFDSDDEELHYFTPSGRHLGHIWLHYGNSGYDVVADYGGDIDQYITEAEELSEEFQG